MFNNLDFQMIQCPNVPISQCSNVQMFKCSNVHMFTCSNAQMIKCQMSNVNKVKLLWERTSGVPPVIFYFHFNLTLRPISF